MTDTEHRNAYGPADWKTPVPWLATWFGCGLIKPAPGTWGTLGGVPAAFLVYHLSDMSTYVLIGFIVILGGTWVCDQYQRQTGKHDADEVVIDEVAGIWIALLPALPDPVFMALAFILFRGLDILKPGPIGWCDKHLKNGWGVMADDLLAGAIAAAVIGGISHGFG